LIPQLVEQGAFVLYVDLWADPLAEPAQVISSAIREALSPFAPTLKKTGQEHRHYWRDT
jgi:hypothetical protein